MAAQPVQGLVICALAGVFVAVGPRRFGLLWEWLSSLPRRILGRTPPPAPSGRPLEVVARDAQRLGRRFRYVAVEVSFIRFEGTRRAYDDVLAEACEMLDVPHLIRVLPPGPELDVERQRVELALDHAGLRLDDVA
jgi:hypothetical protein